MKNNYVKNIYSFALYRTLQEVETIQYIEKKKKALFLALAVLFEN